MIFRPFPADFPDFPPIFRLSRKQTFRESRMDFFEMSALSGYSAHFDSEFRRRDGLVLPAPDRRPPEKGFGDAHRSGSEGLLRARARQSACLGLGCHYQWCRATAGGGHERRQRLVRQRLRLRCFRPSQRECCRHRLVRGTAFSVTASTNPLSPRGLGHDAGAALPAKRGHRRRSGARHPRHRRGGACFVSRARSATARVQGVGRLQGFGPTRPGQRRPTRRR